MNERRKAVRYLVDKDYFFFPMNKSKVYPCKVRNISATGACIVSKKELHQNEIVYLHITGLKNAQFKSEVVWVQNGLYGLMFHFETPQDFENISFVMNAISKKINENF